MTQIVPNVPRRLHRSGPRQDGSSVEPKELVGFSEEQLRFLAESLPQIAWTGLPDGRIDFMNSRWFEYTGLTPEETYNEQVTAVHPADYDRYKQSWDDAVKKQQPYEVEYRFRRGSDGAYRWHLGRALPVRDMQGRVIKWFGTCTDIHAQKASEEEVRRQNEQLEAMIEERTVHLRREIEQRRKTEQQDLEHLMLLQRMINMLPMAALAVDSAGLVLHLNRQFRAFFGSRVVFEAPGGSAAELLRLAAESVPSPAWETLLLRISGTEPFASELPLYDGRTLAVDYIPGKRDGSYLLLLRDVTQEKRADAVKSEFMSLASHQLRSPLTSIRWALGRFARTLRDRLLPEEQELLNKARMSAAAMAQTIRTMLSVSRVESGMHPTTPSSLPLGSFLRSIHGNFAEAAKARGIDLSVDCPTGILLYTDPLVLREILENLLTNAIKYTPSGGSVQLCASAHGQTVQIEVRDSGVGIPEHQQEKIFTKFFRADNILHVDTEGTGLGLYLVSRLMDMLGGIITFESKAGQGTVFTLSFPVA